MSNEKSNSINELPLFQTLFVNTVAQMSQAMGEQENQVLLDFGRQVVGRLSDEFAYITAKGGNFFREREAEGFSNTERYKYDQSMRAHLMNGLLPVLRIGHWLAKWGAFSFRYWNPTTMRLFMAGYVLHDFTKLPSVHEQLESAGFKLYAAPDERAMPLLEDIFQQWCDRLGLKDFLAPIGVVEELLHDLIYVAVNTQRRTGTASRPSFYQKPHVHFDALRLATDLSHLADLVAYVARDPRSMVRHQTIKDSIVKLAEKDGRPLARLIYHYVAENRGLILNFIHNGLLEMLTVEGAREPLLYAPSGVVYLERYDAPAIPDKATLVENLVGNIREKAKERVKRKGVGAKRGNTGLQTSDIYDDFFSLVEYIQSSPKLVEKFITNNKSQDRVKELKTHSVVSHDMPNLPEGAKDARVDQLAEWAAMMERVISSRHSQTEADRFVSWLIERWGQTSRFSQFNALRQDKTLRSGGIFYWWFWIAGHFISDNPTLSPEQITEYIEQTAQELAQTLTEPLPEQAQVRPLLWEELADYIEKVLTTSELDSLTIKQGGISHYSYTKAKGRQKTRSCAICGSDYKTREQVETMVAYQPGVYSSRIEIGSTNNKRFICSICTTEELLRQLYMDKLDSGRTAEGQRIRYLTLYPTYFFTPETLDMTRQVYEQLSEFSFSNVYGQIFRNILDNNQFWQRLGPFLLKPNDADDDKPKRPRLLRYQPEATATFVTLGFRNFNDPSDVESWVLPAWLALLLPLLLDVKVVASESSVPLLLEASDLPQTVWLDGVHPAIREIIDAARLKVALQSAVGIVEQVHSGVPINLDELLEALKWLSIAYIIHIDTEKSSGDEKWSRFVAIAHSLVESPLYVFHHLKRQERDDGKKSISKGQVDQVSRYVEYAKILNDPNKGGLSMSHAEQLVKLYRGFYRAKNFKSNSILRPLAVVSEAILSGDSRLFPDAESQVELAYGELYRFMERVASGAADGFFPKGTEHSDREAAMREFCAYFVKEVFYGVFRGDISALRGRQLNLLRSACEVIYRDLQAREKQSASVNPSDESSSSE